MATALTSAQLTKWSGNDPVAKDLSLPTLLNTVISELNTASAANVTNASAITALQALWTELGLSGKKVAFGNSAFVTTGTTVEIPAYTAGGADMATIDCVMILPMAAWAATELLYADLAVTVGAGAGDNTTTITRLAGTTSALAFSYIVIGD